MGLFDQFFGRQQRYERIESVLDLVNFAAGLVSNPAAVDTVLDAVRVVSSGVEPGKPLSPQQEEALLGVYLQLEDYLATREPLRVFTPAQLRQRLGPDLLQRLQTFEANTRPRSFKHKRVMVN